MGDIFLLMCYDYKRKILKEMLMDSHVQFRKATKKDLNYVADLATILENAEIPFDSNIKPGYYQTKIGRKYLLKDIRDKKKIFLVATINNQVIGFIDGYIYNKKEEYIDSFGYLNRVSVSNQFQKRGIGSALIQEFTNHVLKQGAKYIKLNAFEKNTPAVTLYQKLGFQEYSIYYAKEIKQKSLPNK